MATQLMTEYGKDTDPRTNGLLTGFQGFAPVGILRFGLTAVAGVDGEIFLLRQLPPGRFVVYPRLSYLQIDALGASRVIAVGYQAYTDETGAAVAAAASAFDSGVSVASAVNLQLGASAAAGTGGIFEFNSRSGVNLVATVTGGTVPASSKINGYFTVSLPGGL